MAQTTAGIVGMDEAMGGLARKLYQGRARRVSVPLPEGLPGGAVFAWVRRCCIDRVLDRHFPGLEPCDLVQRFEGFRTVDGLFSAVYTVRVATDEEAQSCIAVM